MPKLKGKKILSEFIEYFNHAVCAYASEIGGNDLPYPFFKNTQESGVYLFVWKGKTYKITFDEE